MAGGLGYGIRTVRARQKEPCVDAITVLASWGAAVLRPYMIAA
jgi:hypothetical protein